MKTFSVFQLLRVSAIFCILAALGAAQQTTVLHDSSTKALVRPTMAELVANATNLAALDLTSVKDALQEVATHRATNGAQQSRIGFATEVLKINQANLEAANSRITDVDVATESTQLARYNILVQAGTAMLSQANQNSQAALRLLG